MKYYLLLSFTSRENLNSNQEFKKSERHSDDIESLPLPGAQSLTIKAVQIEIALKALKREAPSYQKQPLKRLHPPSFHDASLCSNLVSPPMVQRNGIFPSFHTSLVGYHCIHLQALQGRGTASWRSLQHLTQLGRNQSLSLCIIFVRPKLHNECTDPVKQGSVISEMRK